MNVKTEIKIVLFSKFYYIYAYNDLWLSDIW